LLVSIGTAACLLFATVASALVGSHREAPAYALSSSVIFYLERFLATLAGSYLVLAVVVRGLTCGELPTGISREGMTWPESAASGADDAIAALQAQIDRIEFDVEELSERAVLHDLA
jgi:hypothetical protein